MPPCFADVTRGPVALGRHVMGNCVAAKVAELLVERYCSECVADCLFCSSETNQHLRPQNMSVRMQGAWRYFAESARAASALFERNVHIFRSDIEASEIDERLTYVDVVVNSAADIEGTH